MFTLSNVNCKYFFNQLILDNHFINVKWNIVSNNVELFLICNLTFQKRFLVFNNYLVSLEIFPYFPADS